MPKKTKIFLMLFGFVGIPAIFEFLSVYRASHCKLPNSTANSDLRNAKAVLDDYFARNGHYPSSLSQLVYKPYSAVQVDCALNPKQYVCVSAHEEGMKEFLVCDSRQSIFWRKHEPGSLVRANLNWDCQKLEPAWTELK